jgi:multidrug efflux pump subunit AcrA (membrane-fusion protein)
MKRFTTNNIIGSLAAIAVVAGAIWYLQRPGRAADSDTDQLLDSVVLQPVRVMPISRSESAMMPQRYTATVVARRTSQLAFQATERVDRILFDEGDFVSEGQLLATQDQAAIHAQYDAAVARSKQTSAVLAELEKGPRKETIEASRAELLRLKAQSELSRSNFQRQTNLRQSRASSAQEYDAAKFEAAASEAAVVAAQQKLDELEAGTRKEQIEAQKGALGVIKATIDQAKTRLDQTELFAPFSGRISKRFVDEGSLPQRGAPIFEIVESDHLEVRFGVSPEIATRLSPGDELKFTGSGRTHKGNVRQIQPKLNRSTRTRQVIVNVDDSRDSGLVDGQTVAVEFALESDIPGFWIPTEALQPQVRGLWSVLVINDSDSNGSVAERRDVEVLATWGSWSRVRGTLEESDQVIIEGATRISSGQKVSTSSGRPDFPWQQEDVVQLEPENPTGDR